jgi:hypothetical protein
MKYYDKIMCDPDKYKEIIHFVYIFREDYPDIRSGIDNYGTFFDIRERIITAYILGQNSRPLSPQTQTKSPRKNSSKSNLKLSVK